MENLTCPHCDKKLMLEQSYNFNSENYGILICDCYEYPVVSSIPIIVRGKLYNADITMEEISALIKRKQFKDAFIELSLSGISKNTNTTSLINFIPYVRKIARLKRVFRKLEVNKRKRHAKEFLSRSPHDVTAREMIDFYFTHYVLKNVDARDYFLYRFGQPRHHVSLSLVSIMTGTLPIVDLACGMGHITRGLSNMYPNNEIIGLDRDFYLLYIAKHIIAPNANYICCDMDTKLPFGCTFASGVLCANSFHILSDKELCANEICRIIRDDGIILLTSLRHSFIEVKTRNTALSPEGYLKLFHDKEKIIVSDKDILNRYIALNGPDLLKGISLTDAEKEPLISIIVANSRDAFKEYGKFAKYPHKNGALGINPLYKHDQTKDYGEIETYNLCFPSEFFKEENQEMIEYMPKTIKVRRQHSGLEVELPEGSRDFCVLMDIPSRYG